MEGSGVRDIAVYRDQHDNGQSLELTTGAVLDDHVLLEYSYWPDDDSTEFGWSHRFTWEQWDELVASVEEFRDYVPEPLSWRERVAEAVRRWFTGA